jgi:formaldehyde-activating enzyme involved in methanogenesis
MEETTEVKQKPIVGRVAILTGKAYGEGDESWHDDLMGILDGFESYQKENESKNSELIKLFESDPVLVSVIKDMMAGYSFVSAIAKNVDGEELAAVTKDEAAPEELQKAKQARIEAKQKADADAKAWEDAKAASAQAIDDYIAENNLNEQEAADLLATIDEFVMPILSMQINGDFLGKIKKAKQYDSKVASAKEEGLLEGTNKKIEVQKETLENENPLPDISSGGGNIQEVKNEKKGIMGKKTYLEYLQGK